MLTVREVPRPGAVLRALLVAPTLRRSGVTAAPRAVRRLSVVAAAPRRGPPGPLLSA